MEHESNLAPGPERPAEKPVITSISLARDLHDRAKEQAKRRHRSLSGHIRVLLEEDLEREAA